MSNFHYKKFKKIMASKQVEHVCMNPDDYHLLMNLGARYLDADVVRYDIKRGMRASMFSTDIWVNPQIPSGFIRVFSSGENPESNLDKKWSINIDILEFDKMMKLKSFW